MAHWGIGYCNGPNYNQPQMYDDMVPCAKEAFDYSRSAFELRGHASPVERALIDALQHRYCWPYSPADLPKLNQAYADAMERVYQQFSDDVDVACLFAEALMILRPWKLWDITTGKHTRQTSATIR